jgi:glutamine amidotransferase
MCRVLAYLGSPAPIDSFLYKPDNSLINQAYDPEMLHMMNLAGFGMAAWDSSSRHPSQPFIYRSTALPIFDRNLRALADKVWASCLLAHVRGVPYSHQSVLSEQNAHPFTLPGIPLAMAHNGDLARFSEMKFRLLSHIRPEFARAIAGTTDSEWVFALLLSQLADPFARPTPSELVRAMNEVLRVLRRVREEAGIMESSAVNLFATDGQTLVAARFTFDFGCWQEAPTDKDLRCPSLWYTTGRDYGFRDGEWKMAGGDGPADSFLFASEPLTTDVSTWVELPEYSITWVCGGTGMPHVQTVAADA